MHRRSLAGLLALAAPALLARPSARAQGARTRIALGYTATADFWSCFVAKDQGLFEKRGLDVTPTLIALNSTIPAAMLGGSLQVGGPTPSVLLQANDGGLDLVVVAGAGATSPQATDGGLLVRNGLELKAPQDVVGKKIGVPGLGAFLHVLARQWLIEKGVDWKRVNFVEVPFAQMSDMLRAGTVDGVITGGQSATRIVQARTGQVAFPFLNELPPGIPSTLYATTRAWAAANPGAVEAFQEATAEAVALGTRDPEAARASVGKHVRMPADVLAAIVLPAQSPTVTDQQMQYWVDVMAGQEMLRTRPDVSRLIVR
jgi:NitT/TauT family transport system substrate-binding protein